MELSDVIFRSRLRVAILVLVVVAAVAISSVVTLQSPREYTSSVAFVAPSTNRGNPAAVEQAVANLRANLGAGSVVTAVADASGLDPRDVRDVLSLSRRGASDTVELTVTTERRGIAEDVAVVAAQALVNEVTSVDLQQASEQTARIRAEVEEIQGEFDAFMAQTDLAIPDEEFRNLSSELTSLRVALANAVIDGSPRVAPLQAAVAEREAALDELAPLVRRYQEFNLSLDRAQRRLDSAVDTEATVAGLLAGVEEGALVPDRESTVDRGPEVARAAAGAGGIAIVVCLLLFTILELRRAGAARREARTESTARPPVPAPPATRAPDAPIPPPVRSEGVSEVRAESAPMGLR